MNLVDEIVEKLNNKFNGKLVCEEQRADLFVYINGYEETIVAVDTEMIFFENEEHNVNLYDADIQHLVYINEIL
jgi:hypothetical protein